MKSRYILEAVLLVLDSELGTDMEKGGAARARAGGSRMQAATVRRPSTGRLAGAAGPLSMSRPSVRPDPESSGVWTPH